MQRRSVQWAALAAVVLLAAALRVYDLKDVPAGLFCDEAALGYNSYALGTAGIDENGRTLPLFVWSFGGYKNPIYIYAGILPVKLFGLDEFSTRLTAALFGIGGIVAMFFLGRAIFNPWVGLFAALFLTLCPWHLHFSRIGFELISFPFLFTVGLTLLVRYTQGRRTLAAGMFFCALCLYAYAISAVFVPLFLVGFSLLYLPTLLRRWKETLLALAVIVATVAPAGIFYQRHPQATGYFRNTTMLAPGRDLRAQVEQLAANYAAFLSPRFLFESGDSITRHAVRGFGQLLPATAPFIVLGALVALLRRDRASKLALWWVAVYPIAPSLMTEIPSASRGIMGAPGFSLLAGIGLGAALHGLGWIMRRRPLALAAQTAALAGLGYMLVPQFTRYLHAYFVEYPKYSAPTYGGFQFGYRDSIHYMESQRDKFDLLMLTAVEVNQPQIFPLFYNAVDPRQWAASPHSPRDLGYLILDPAEYSRYGVDQRVLYQLRPSDLYYFTDYTIHKRITTPAGQDEFVIAEVRDRKRFLTNWLVVGPFDNTGGSGERKAFIDVNHVTRNQQPGTLGDGYWRPINPQFVRVDLNQFFAARDPRHPGNPEEVCAYAAMTVQSPTAHSAFLELAGTQDSLDAWLNGQRLTPGPMVLSDAPRRRPIELRAGDNLLLVKSCENIGSWYFTARITDENGRDLTDISTTASIPDTPPSVAPAAAGASPALQIVEGFDGPITYKHTQSPYPDYRGGTESWWTNLRDAQAELVWRSAPVPKKEPTVLAFTFSHSEASGEAELYVNGKYALTFAVGDVRPGDVYRRGPYRLVFLPRAHIAGNSGVMLLQIPADDITPGQPVELRVIPVRGDEAPWVMIKGYRDTVQHEQLSPDTVAELLNASWTTSARQ